MYGDTHTVTYTSVYKEETPPYSRKIKDANHCKFYNIYLYAGGIKIEIAVIPNFCHCHLLYFYSTVFIQEGINVQVRTINVYGNKTPFSEDSGFQDLSSISCFKQTSNYSISQNYT